MRRDPYLQRAAGLSHFADSVQRDALSAWLLATHTRTISLVRAKRGTSQERRSMTGSNQQHDQSQGTSSSGSRNDHESQVGQPGISGTGPRSKVDGRRGSGQQHQGGERNRERSADARPARRAGQRPAGPASIIKEANAGNRARGPGCPPPRRAADPRVNTGGEEADRECTDRFGGGRSTVPMDSRAPAAGVGWFDPGYGSGQGGYGQSDFGGWQRRVWRKEATGAGSTGRPGLGLRRAGRAREPGSATRSTARARSGLSIRPGRLRRRRRLQQRLRGHPEQGESG